MMADFIEPDPDFIKFLEKASEKVRSWPEWKRNLLGPALPEDREKWRKQKMQSTITERCASCGVSQSLNDLELEYVCRDKCVRTNKDLATRLLESQAREAVLVALTKEWLASNGQTKDEVIAKAKDLVYRPDQTIFDGFSQRVAKSLLAYIEILKDVGYEEWADQCLDTLTPEDIALLETMKGGL